MGWDTTTPDRPSRSIRNFVALLCAAICLLIATGAAGQPTISVDEKLRELPLGSRIEVALDPSGKATIDTACAPGGLHFAASEEEVPNFGFTQAAAWFRFYLVNTGERPATLILEQSYALVDTVELYEADGHGGFTLRRGGDQVSLAEREIQFRNSTFKLHLESGERRLIYMRGASTSSLQFPLTLWRQEAFLNAKLFDEITYGLLYGIIVVMILYNLVLYATTREVTFILYCLNITAGVLFIGALNGHTAQYLWPGSPWWINHSVPVLMGAYGIGTILFARSFLHTRVRAPRIDKTFLVLLYSFVAILLAGLITIRVVTRLGTVLCIVDASLLAAAGAFIWRGGYRPARFFVIAWITFCFGVIVYALKSLGLVPPNAITHNSLSLGVALEAVLISMALGDRIQTLKEEREQADQKAMAAQKRAVENLRHADRVKDEFLANTSHELRTPLTGIIGIVDSLLAGAQGSLPAETREDLALVNDASQRLARLVNDILDFSKLRHKDLSLELTAIDLHETVDVTFILLRRIAEQRQVRLVNDVSETLPRVLADEDRLQQILHNLIGNAIKFTENGTVTVTATVADESLVYVSVRDTGMGIKRQHLTTIFSSFEQVDGSSTRLVGGTGLGLAIARYLVELHGGEIHATSDGIGQGAAFIFSLPVAEAQSVPAGKQRATTKTPEVFDAVLDEDGGSETIAGQETSVPAAATALTDVADALVVFTDKAAPGNAAVGNAATPPLCRVLVVDDDEVIRHALRNQLTIKSCTVVTAASGQAALDVVGEQEFDVVLLDVMMPQINGYDVAKRMRQTHSPLELPIIMLTAKNQPAAVLEGFRVGANDYVAKPFNAEELIARVNTFSHLRRLNQDLLRAERSQAELERQRILLTEQVADALAKMLSGFIPICCNCKNIRDDIGTWHRLEGYLAKRTDAQFTHSICPTCMRKLYPQD